MVARVSIGDAMGRLLASIDPKEKWKIRPWSVFNAISMLTPREQKVLALLYGLNDGVRHTEARVARQLDTTPDRVRQIERKALRKLRQPSRRRLITSDDILPLGVPGLLADKSVTDE